MRAQLPSSPHLIGPVLSCAIQFPSKLPLRIAPPHRDGLGDPSGVRIVLKVLNGRIDKEVVDHHPINHDTGCDRHLRLFFDGFRCLFQFLADRILVRGVGRIGERTSEGVNPIDVVRAVLDLCHRQGRGFLFLPAHLERPDADRERGTNRAFRAGLQMSIGQHPIADFLERGGEELPLLAVARTHLDLRILRVDRGEERRYRPLNQVGAKLDESILAWVFPPVEPRDNRTIVGAASKIFFVVPPCFVEAILPLLRERRWIGRRVAQFASLRFGHRRHLHRIREILRRKNCVIHLVHPHLDPAIV